MASIRQGYLDDYSQNVDKVGIGTSISQEKLQVVGDVMSTGLSVTGIATLTSTSGFIERNLEYVENVDIDAGDSATLSGEIIVGAGLTMTVGTGATAGQGNIDSLKVYSMFQPPTGGTNQRPVGKPGSLFYNTDFKTIEFFDGNSWRQVDNVTRRGRGVWMCGMNPNYTSTIGFINIQSKGNEQSFGDSVNGNAINKAGSANAIRGIWGGEQNPSGNSDDMDYVTMASQGNSIDFGNLTQARPTYGGSFASSTRGIWAGGYTGGSGVNTMDYVQIMTLGNALDFGDLHTVTFNQTACSSPTKGYIISGSPSSFSKYQISSIASKGNATLGGDMTISFGSAAACSNSTRAVVFGGGSPPVDTIDLINLSTEGNAVSFGNLSDVRMLGTAVADGTRAVSVSGRNPSNVNTIEFVQIATGGSTEDFGDMTDGNGRQKFMACSDSHGGLGGF